jgi:uncharacterized membrane protein
MAPPSASKYPFWVLNGILAAVFIAELLCPYAPIALDDLFIVLAAVASIMTLNRQLPLQNVLAAAAITAVFGAVAHGLSAIRDLSLPFGPVVFDSGAGPKIFDFVPWTIPFLWIIAILNARGVARLILRPWRKTKSYGFWLIGITTLLAVAFDGALEPFARHVKHLWIWQPTKITLTWHGATPLNFVGWAFVSLLIMAFATPFLIRKQPGSSGGADIHPLVIWLGALTLFAIGCARAELWGGVGLDAAVAVVTTIFAIRGATW